MTDTAQAAPRARRRLYRPRLHRPPEGSRFDEQHRRRPPRALHRRLRTWLTRPLMAIAAVVLPHLYLWYVKFVWWTSEVEDCTWPMFAGMARHDRVVALLWHEEVFTVGWSYRRHTPRTLASTGNFGRIITRILELCDFRVFRGGSSKARARQRGVLLSMVRHMQQEPDCLYGITVDGSTGPAYELKAGGLLIAKACRAPVFLLRTVASRRLSLPTWDRTVVPLPFSRIKILCLGPYWVAPDCTAQELARAQAHLQDELRELAVHGWQVIDRRDDLRPPVGFPPGWTSRWAPGAPGLRQGPHDLRPEDPPPWAHRPADRPPGRASRERVAAWRRGDPAPGAPDPAQSVIRGGSCSPRVSRASRTGRC